MTTTNPSDAIRVSTGGQKEGPTASRETRTFPSPTDASGTSSTSYASASPMSHPTSTASWRTLDTPPSPQPGVASTPGSAGRTGGGVGGRDEAEVVASSSDEGGERSPDDVTPSTESANVVEGDSDVSVMGGLDATLIDVNSVPEILYSILYLRGCGWVGWGGEWVVEGGVCCVCM